MPINFSADDLQKKGKQLKSSTRRVKTEPKSNPSMYTAEAVKKALEIRRKAIVGSDDEGEGSYDSDEAWTSSEEGSSQNSSVAANGSSLQASDDVSSADLSPMQSDFKPKLESQSPVASKAKSTKTKKKTRKTRKGFSLESEVRHKAKKREITQSIEGAISNSPTAYPSDVTDYEESESESDRVSTPQSTGLAAILSKNLHRMKPDESSSDSSDSDWSSADSAGPNSIRSAVRLTPEELAKKEAETKARLKAIKNKKKAEAREKKLQEIQERERIKKASKDKRYKEKLLERIVSAAENLAKVQLKAKKLNKILESAPAEKNEEYQAKYKKLKEAEQNHEAKANRLFKKASLTDIQAKEVVEFFLGTFEELEQEKSAQTEKSKAPSMTFKRSSASGAMPAIPSDEKINADFQNVMRQIAQKNAGAKKAPSQDKKAQQTAKPATAVLPEVVAKPVNVSSAKAKAQRGANRSIELQEILKELGEKAAAVEKTAKARKAAEDKKTQAEQDLKRIKKELQKIKNKLNRRENVPSLLKKLNGLIEKSNKSGETSVLNQLPETAKPAVGILAAEQLEIKQEAIVKAAIKTAATAKAVAERAAAEKAAMIQNPSVIDAVKEAAALANAKQAAEQVKIKQEAILKSAAEKKPPPPKKASKAPLRTAKDSVRESAVVPDEKTKQPSKDVIAQVASADTKEDTPQESLKSTSNVASKPLSLKTAIFNQSEYTILRVYLEGQKDLNKLKRDGGDEKEIEELEARLKKLAEIISRDRPDILVNLEKELQSTGVETSELLTTSSAPNQQQKASAKAEESKTSIKPDEKTKKAFQAVMAQVASADYKKDTQEKSLTSTSSVTSRPPLPKAIPRVARLTRNKRINTLIVLAANQTELESLRKKGGDEKEIKEREKSIQNLALSISLEKLDKQGLLQESLKDFVPLHKELGGYISLKAKQKDGFFFKLFKRSPRKHEAMVRFKIDFVIALAKIQNTVNEGEKKQLLDKLKDDTEKAITSIGNFHKNNFFNRILGKKSRVLTALHSIKTVTNKILEGDFSVESPVQKKPSSTSTIK